MGHDERIARILESLTLARAIPGDQALSASISSAVVAVTVSARRAVSGERHVAAAALTSVASGALYCVAAASREEEVGPRTVNTMRRIAHLCEGFVDGPLGEPGAAHDEDTSEGWKGGLSNEFLRTTDQCRSLRILRWPRFLGGELGVFWSAAAIGSATSPVEAPRIAERLETFLGTRAA